MSLTEALERGLNTVPDCRAVCYIDMASGLVLGTKCRTPYPQEALDRLAAMAAILLRGEGMSAAAASGGMADGTPQAILVARNSAHVFVQAQGIPEHALCYVCDRPMDLERVSLGIEANRKAVADAI